jgi:hypothetical protein
MYIVTVVYLESTEIGKQHLRKNWSGAIEIAVKEAMANDATDEDAVKTALESECRYDCEDAAVVIGQANTVD